MKWFLMQTHANTYPPIITRAMPFWNALRISENVPVFFSSMQQKLDMKLFDSYEKWWAHTITKYT